ncbi:MAG: hypothetical protein L6R40_006946 [Gallowayella cf. fulva]|nr:MAG: hypothetical protein L6R40_006946 [Xanthomendoza cf. fulva]
MPSWTGPMASIWWAPLKQTRVYGQNPDGWVQEWIFKDNQWSGPSAIGAQAHHNMAMTAVTDETHIRLYYFFNGRLHEYVYTQADGWRAGAMLP